MKYRLVLAGLESKLSSNNISLRANPREGGGGGRGELALMSQEFEFLHQKSGCKMLIGGEWIWCLRHYSSRALC